MTFKKHSLAWIMTFGVSLIVPILSVTACAPEDEAFRTDVFRGEAIYNARCAGCHGAQGKGAGPESLGLGQAPPSLRFLSARNGGVFPREYVMSTIDGLSRHNQTVAMPEFGAKDMGPLIQVEENGLSTPTPADLIAVTTYLETIQD